SLGLPRDHLATESFDYKLRPSLLGWHRVGLTDSLTTGVRVEADLDTLSGGGSLNVRLPIGEIEASVSGSVARGGGAGVAGRLAWAWIGRRVSGGISAS